MQGRMPNACMPKGRLQVHQVGCCAASPALLASRAPSRARSSLRRASAWSLGSCFRVAMGVMWGPGVRPSSWSCSALAAAPWKPGGGG